MIAECVQLNMPFYSSFLFFSVLSSTPFPWTLKCCIQLAKPGKLPLVSVNQEKNSGTHILMITELGKKCLSSLTSVFSFVLILVFPTLIGSPHHPFHFAGCNRKATPWHCFECVLFVALVGIDCLVLAFLNDFFPHTASVNLWSHPPDLAVAAKASLL